MRQHTTKSDFGKIARRRPARGVAMMALGELQADSQDPMARAEATVKAVDEFYGDWPPRWSVARLRRRLTHSYVLHALVHGLAIIFAAALLSLALWFWLVGFLSL